MTTPDIEPPHAPPPRRRRKSPPAPPKPRVHTPSPTQLTPTPPSPPRQPLTPQRNVPPWIDHLIALALNPLSDTPPVLAPALTPHSIATDAAAHDGPDRLRLALTLLRTHDAVDLTVLVEDATPGPSLVALIDGPAPPAEDLYAAPADKAALVVAAHSLCSNKDFRESFLSANGLQSLCNLLSPPTPTPPLPTSTSANSNTSPDRPSPPITPSSDSSSTISTTLDPPIPRPVWNAAIRTIAKLMVCSVTACSLAISTGALRLLARAARPGQPMDIRLRAAAGLAAIAAWSGPRRAVEIVQTDDVVLSMSALLTESDERIPNDLRNATIDGLVVMSFRRHARRILQKYGCEDKIKAAARRATVSGDYTMAARGTVAAGQLTGRSIDEYGFLVEDNPQKPDSSFRNSEPRTRDDEETASKASGESAPSDDARPRKQATGLRQIQQQLLEEPYTEVEDLTILEEIVHEEAGVLSSSPRDRNFIRRAARSYGVSADEIEFISVAEDDATNQEEAAAVATPTKGARPGSVTQGPASLFGLHKIAVQAPALAEAQGSSSGSSGIVMVGAARGSGSRHGSGTGTQIALSKDQNVSSAPRSCSNVMMPMDDPDFDRNFRESMEGSSRNLSSTGTGPSGNILPPLLMFSSATKKAAEKDRKNNLLQKTNSQLTRETENERTWREVLETRPEMLKRERGRSSRVVAYRELALVPVPSPLRRTLWPILLDTASVRESSPGLYDRLCKEGEQETLPDDIEHTIEADVTRTMPLHSLFWAGGAQVGVQSLRSILRAYAFYAPTVGYCQGMSSIAAVLIMNAKDEEEAFLMMVQFMSRFQYKKVFAPGFPLMLQWISELKPLVAHYMPELNARLERENVFIELYADKWLITALSHNFPHRHLLRVWDLMFLGGSPKIILKACLAVLKSCEERLMTMDFETMMPFLQREFADPEQGVLNSKDPEPFITRMREFRFLPDLPKTDAKSASPISQSNSKTPRAQGRQRRREGRSGGSCLPCFRRSQTVD